MLSSTSYLKTLYLNLRVKMWDPKKVLKICPINREQPIVPRVVLITVAKLNLSKNCEVRYKMKQSIEQIKKMHNFEI